MFALYFFFRAVEENFDAQSFLLLFVLFFRKHNRNAELFPFSMCVTGISPKGVHTVFLKLDFDNFVWTLVDNDFSFVIKHLLPINFIL